MFWPILHGILLGALAHTGAAQTHSAPNAWLEFSKSPARGAEKVTISIGTADPGIYETAKYWARREGALRGWTDSQECAELQGIVESLRSLPAIQLAPVDDQIIVSDATGYAVTVRHSNEDSVTVTSAGGALGDWVDEALAKLDGCWPSR